MSLHTFIEMNRLWNLSRRILNELYLILRASSRALIIMYGMDDDEWDTDEPVAVEPKKKAVPYEEKYLERYKQLTSTTSPSKTSFIIENTPIGNVVMKYDEGKESFLYYSDHIVPFRYLETVAMKYVCVFKCKQIYVERREEVVPASKQPKTTKDIMSQARNPTVTKKEQIEVKMNRYSNGGRFSNFQVLQPVAKHVTDKKQLMKFSDFKTTTTFTQRQPLINNL